MFYFHCFQKMFNAYRGRFLEVSLIRTSNLCACSSVNMKLFNSFNMRFQKSGVNSIALSEFTSEEYKNNCVKRLKNFVVPAVSRKKPSKKAAVLIPLCVKDNEISLLYTLRRRDLKRHRGQVSFPGGIQDSEDENLTETALRETEEELGLSRSLVDVWGHANPIIGTEFSVLPVLGFIGDIDDARLIRNPDEVELVFTVPLSHFCDKNNCKFTQFRFKNGGRYVMPLYINAPCRIWGMTAVMTHLILRALIPDEYTYELPLIKYTNL